MAITKLRMDECFRWLRYVLNPRRDSIPPIQNWQAVYDFAEKQQIIGVCSPTPYAVRVDQKLLYRWIGDEQQIRNRNNDLNRRIESLSQILTETGFRFCILKGQGNAEMYPDAGLRCPGDIDVWIDGKEEAIIDFVKKWFPEEEQSFKHIKFPVFDDVEVDVHTTPLKLYHPKHHKELQKWIHEHKEHQFAHLIKLTGTDTEVSVPTARFNATYQLGHILIHLMDEGIGLRHLVDYYYVLRTLGQLSDEEKNEIADEWKQMGMLRLASAVMWVEKEILGLPEELLIVKPDGKRGKILLDEMLEGGNFGHYSSIQELRDSYFAFRFSKAGKLMKVSSLFPGEATFRLIHKAKIFVKHVRKG